MIEEDFYYSKDSLKNFITKITAKTTIIIIAIFSILLFFYITTNAYYFSYEEKGNNIKIIKSPVKIIKTNVKNNYRKIDNIDKMIYRNLVGNIDEKTQKKKIKTIDNVQTPLYQEKNQPVIIKNKTKEKKIVKIKKSQKELTEIKENNTKEIGLKVQIAAMGSRQSAQRYWKYILKHNKKLVKNYDKYITKIDLGKRGIFYRLQIGNFATSDIAKDFCQEFIAKNNKGESDCIILD